MTRKKLTINAGRRMNELLDAILTHADMIEDDLHMCRVSHQTGDIIRAEDYALAAAQHLHFLINKAREAHGMPLRGDEQYPTALTNPPVANPSDKHMPEPITRHGTHSDRQMELPLMPAPRATTEHRRAMLDNMRRTLRMLREHQPAPPSIDDEQQDAVRAWLWPEYTPLAHKLIAPTPAEYGGLEPHERTQLMQPPERGVYCSLPKETDLTDLTAMRDLSYGYDPYNSYDELADVVEAIFEEDDATL